MEYRLVENLEKEQGCGHDASLVELAYQMDFRYV